MAAQVYPGVSFRRRGAEVRRWGAELRRPQAAAYRGEDRRATVITDRALPGGWFSGAIAVTTISTIVVAATADVSIGAGLDIALLAAQLDGGAFTLALALMALCFVRWRLTAESAAAWIGTAAALYGGLTIGLGRVLVGSGLSVDGPLASVPGTARLVAFVAILAAILAPEIDANLRPVRLVAATSAITIGLGLAVAELPTVLRSPVTLTAVWALLGAGAMWKGLHRHRHLLVWCGLSFLTLAAVAGVSVVAVDATPGSVSALAPSLFRLLGLLWAVIGVTSGLARAYRHQGGRLLDSLTAESMAEAKVRAAHEAQCERAHEARNAIAVIQATTFALRYEIPDDPGSKALTEGLATELRRLVELVDPPSDGAVMQPFDVAAVVGEVAEAARVQDDVVSVHVRPGLQALGNAAETSQVLHNLLQNARRYAGGRVTIRAAAEGDEVAIRVADDGPGIPDGDRGTIFERGARGSAALGTDGEGLGLFIAKRLMTEQGGDLRLEEHHGTGTCFTVVLPSTAPLGQEIVDEGQEGREVPVTS